MKYTIEVNKKQMDVMAEALEFYTRFVSGQMEFKPPALENWMWKEHKEDWNSKNELYDNSMSIVKNVVFGFARNQHAGISSPVPEVAIGYEMYKMMLLQRHNEWHEDNPKDTSYSVHSSPPLEISGEEMIIIQKLKEK
tara:strand:+ start:72 stop:485 length:414 start_codon:yes stop_codon:yes gene_type:complete